MVCSGCSERVEEMLKAGIHCGCAIMLSWLSLRLWLLHLVH